MIEIRFHGRGGLGAVTASELFAQAAFLEGKYPQAFPFFGVERRGAPVTAFLRVDDKPLSVRTAIAEPDIVVVFERSLLKAAPVTKGLEPNGLLLVNCESEEAVRDAGHRGPTAILDATALALSFGLGTQSVPIVGTVMLGALARTSRFLELASLTQAIRAHQARMTEANVRAAAAGYESVRFLPSLLEVLA